MSGSSDSIPDTPAGAPPTLAPTPPTPPKRRRSSGSAKPPTPATPATPATPGGNGSGASDGDGDGDKSGNDGDKGDKGDKKGGGSSGGKRKRNALNPVSSAADDIAAWPVPGGLALLFVLIVVLLFVIVPVNGGRTRVQLIWDTVRGRVRLPGVQTQQDAAAAASSNGQPSTANDLATAAQAALSSVLTGGAVGSGVPSLATGDVSGLGANESADGSSMLDALGLPDLSDFSAPDLESLYAN